MKRYSIEKKIALKRGELEKLKDYIYHGKHAGGDALQSALAEMESLECEIAALKHALYLERKKEKCHFTNN